MKKVVGFSLYKNDFVTFLYKLFHKGFMRGFYFDYILNKKYIIFFVKGNFSLNSNFNFVFSKIKNKFKLLLAWLNFNVLF
jgi:hypothetical protein